MPINQVVIELLNGEGAPISDITIEANTESGPAQPTGTTQVMTNASGQAVFSNLILGESGTYSLGFRIQGSTGNYLVPGVIEVEEAPDVFYFQIEHTTSAGICAPTALTISIRDGNDDLIEDFTGKVIISNSQNAGTYVKGPNAQGNLVTVSAGVVEYEFSDDDNGQAVIHFSSTSTLTGLSFTATSHMDNMDDIDPGSSAAPLDMTVCQVRVSHSGTSDVCSMALVTMRITTTAGTVVPLYAGTINISTSTSQGNWTVNTGTPANLSNIGNGVANYTYSVANAGEVTFGFTHGTTSSGVDFTVSAGSFSANPSFNPPLAIDPCTFRISLAPSITTACSVTTVTFEVWSSVNDARATHFTGEMQLTTSTNHGTWISTTGAGTLIDNNPNNGTGRYQFVAADANPDGAMVDIVFSSTVVETLNIIATAPGITVDSNFNPTLRINACLPVMAEYACYDNQSQSNAVNLLSSEATGGSRMVLMYIASESQADVTGASIGTSSMEYLWREKNTDGDGLTLEVWAIKDEDLPAGAGAYDAAFTGAANDPAMCLVVLNYVEQNYPEYDIDSPNSGTLNRTQATGITNNPYVSATAVTTSSNNSIVISAIATGQDMTMFESTLANRLWATTGVMTPDPSPNGVEFFGSYELFPQANAITVTEQSMTTTHNRVAHVVLAIGPIVDGPPAAEGYVPVTLYRTFSGKVNYRAIGNTLRSTPDNPTLDGEGNFLPDFNFQSCQFVAETTGSTATLVLPPDVDIKAAYLYWAASGAEEHIDRDVMFGPDGDQVPIFAPQAPVDQVFRITNPYGELYSFFAAYVDVQGVVLEQEETTYRFSHLTAQDTAEWEDNRTCLSGWALVVVYEAESEDLNVINLFHGFQPFRNSSFTLVPRNFRMASPDDARLPYGTLTHVTFEGDELILDGDEVIELQNDPNSFTFTALINDYNPIDNQYNGTVSYPEYDEVTGEFIGYVLANGQSYGVDIDTYYVEGVDEPDSPGDIEGILHPFGLTEAEQITTRYGTGGDIVLLTGEFIAITNSPIADLEIFVTGAGNFRVGSDGTARFLYEVVNNGDGTDEGGYADGIVLVTGNMPNGVTLVDVNPITAPGWDCSYRTATAFTCSIDIANDWTTGIGADINGQLQIGESLPVIEVFLKFADDTFFTALNNDITTVGRVSHNGGNCTDIVPAGQHPNPLECNKSPQFDNVNDLNKYLIDIDDINEKQPNNNNVDAFTVNVQGISTDLSVSKAVVGVIEFNSAAQYQVTVTNLGPDATTKQITMVDTLPNGLQPVSASGTNWDCSNISGQQVTCVRTVPLAINSPSVITINTANVVSPANEGDTVVNSASVSVATGNFDNNTANNVTTLNSTVLGQVVASQERFLISVSGADETSLGVDGPVGPFSPADLILYDPVEDVGSVFLATNSVPNSSIQDINAVHLLPNGHLVLSTSDASAQLAGVSFSRGDLVVFDPILQVATKIFDGATVFGNAAIDIDAVHVFFSDNATPLNWNYDPGTWLIALSTAQNATIGGTPFQSNDLVLYNMSTGLVQAILLDGADGDMFDDTTGNIDAAYIRYGDSDKYIISVDDESVIIIPNDPLALVEFSRIDLVEYDPTIPEATPRFLGDSLPGQFTPYDEERRLNAVHVIEDAYYGHFAITSSGGDTCTAPMITITKHVGLGHTRETSYRGSILLDNGLGVGEWAKDVNAMGTLHFNDGDGTAVYEFHANDQGQVNLYLMDLDSAVTFDVDVSNGIAREAPDEDPNITISQFVEVITYLDQFSTVSYGNNDTSYEFAGPWVEAGDNGLPGSGKIRITSGGELRINDSPSPSQPSIRRSVDFSDYTPSVTPVLSFKWRATNLTLADRLVLEARESTADNDDWIILSDFKELTGNQNPVDPVTITLDDFDFDGILEIQFRVVSGFSVNTDVAFFVDYVQIQTQTNDCEGWESTLGVDHYAITHSGFGISCLAENVTITAHTAAHGAIFPVAGTTISLNTNTGRGTWAPPVNATGAFAATPGTGVATYTFTGTEGSVTFPLFYSELISDPEVLTLSVIDSSARQQVENSPLSFSNAGLRFFNETQGTPYLPTLVAGMPSNLYPGGNGDIITLQAIQANDDNPAVCEALFGPGEDIVVELAFECIDPLECNLGYPVNVSNLSGNADINPVNNNLTTWVSAGLEPIQLRFENFINGDFGDGSYVGAQLVLTYGDVGAMQAHARYNIPELDQQGNPIASNNFMRGSSVGNIGNSFDTAYSFIVRPFGYDIDFSADRNDNGNDDDAESWAEDADGSVFEVAGVGFDTTIRAIAWQAEDDANQDGVPDQGADLFNNPTTPNYGSEITPAQNDMAVTHSLVAPAGGNEGNLSTNTFINFSNGQDTHTMTYSEVGIIDLLANLDSGNYLGSGEGVQGNLKNVGRFRPAHFIVNSSTITRRTRLMCSPASTFTYMGEEFGLIFEMEARNQGGQVTQNYRNGFAKLDAYGQLDFGAVFANPDGADQVFTSRLANEPSTRGFAASYQGEWVNGVLELEGNLIFNRQSPVASPDGPFATVKIGFNPVDGDMVALEFLDIDLDEDEDYLYRQLGADQEFRYGRILLRNAYGSDVALGDGGSLLDVRLDVQYFDGERFVINEMDNCTPFDSDELSFVNGSFTDFLSENDLVIENVSGQVVAGGNVANPLLIRPPGEGNDGSALIELDLEALGLEFLRYEWRGDGELLDVNADDSYDDDPRSLIEFGSFRGHDRIINWQEIFD